MEKAKIITALDKLAASTNSKNVFVIEYKGIRLTMPSNKSSWTTIGAAKNALRNALYSVDIHWRERLELIKELENEGVIQYIKL